MAANIPSDNVVVRNARLAVETELKKKRVLRQPVAEFDPKTRRAYMENADGGITVVSEATKRGLVNGTDQKPEIIVFAGPNGSGKSTVTELLRPPSLDHINADKIQRVWGCDNLEAAKIAENRREEQKKAALLGGPLFYARSDLTDHRKASERMRKGRVKICTIKGGRKQLRIC
jgi:hypothetical protein